MDKTKRNKLVSSLMDLRKDAINWNRERGEIETIRVAPSVFVRDGQIVVSGEDGKDWCDYYGELRGGLPFIDPILEQWASTNDGYWEWVNPGCIAFCEN
jgi:hypothetical protein